jgi:small subunit ribosomal protein S6
LAAYVYEGMFILDSNRYAKDPAGVAGQIDGLVEKLGGETLVSRMWAEQRLAYPIDGHRKGTYWLTYFRLDGQQLNDLTYQCNISENIVRFLFVKHDPRIIDMLVAHAEGHEVGEMSDEDAPIDDDIDEMEDAEEVVDATE